MFRNSLWVFFTSNIHFTKRIPSCSVTYVYTHHSKNSTTKRIVCRKNVSLKLAFLKNCSYIQKPVIFMSTSIIRISLTEKNYVKVSIEMPWPWRLFTSMLQVRRRTYPYISFLRPGVTYAKNFVVLTSDPAAILTPHFVTFLYTIRFCGNIKMFANLPLSSLADKSPNLEKLRF